MRRRESYSEKPDEARTVNIWFKRQFIIVVCGICRRMMTCPFQNSDYWERWHIIVRKWQTCEHCGARLRVSCGTAFSVTDAKELEGFVRGD